MSIHMHHPTTYRVVQLEALNQIMGTMLLDIMNPIYREHPELKPPELEDWQVP